MLSNILKTTAIAGLIGIGVAGVSATPAAASTHCTWHGRCYTTSSYRHHSPYRSYGYHHTGYTGYGYYHRPSSYYHTGYYGYYGPSYYGHSYYGHRYYGHRYYGHRYPRTHVSVGLHF